jgi:hypothetical protein
MVIDISDSLKKVLYMEKVHFFLIMESTMSDISNMEYLKDKEVLPFPMGIPMLDSSTMGFSMAKGY